jgi:hypothetical protein
MAMSGCAFAVAAKIASAAGDSSNTAAKAFIATRML